MHANSNNLSLNSNVCVPIYLGPPTNLATVHTNLTNIKVCWSPPPAAPTQYEISVFTNSRLVQKETIKTDNINRCNISCHEIEINNQDSTANYRVSMVAEGAGLRSITVGPVVALRGEHNYVKLQS